MPYSDFDLRRVVEEFGLIEDRETDLFSGVAPLAASETLRQWLEDFTPTAFQANTEKSRSEFIIAPLLGEFKRRSPTPIAILSGVPFDVDGERGLTGFCDFLITRSPGIYRVKGPVVAVVEAKKEDLIAGFGQCAAEMIAIRLFNAKDKGPIQDVYGCVTSGSNWRFLKLASDHLQVDRTEYYLRDLDKILGILVAISA